MSASIPAMVSPTMLRWARETIDLTPVAASRKIGVPDSRVDEWESGDARPTVAQLKKAAEVYHRSLAVFYLSEPPEGFDTLRDFRRNPGEQTGTWSPDLHAEYRRAHEQREYLLELHDVEGTVPLDGWRLPNVPEADEALAEVARARLLSLTPLRPPSGRATAREHLNAWIAAVEASGVLVLNTAGGRVKPREMRGFSLYFEQLPVIMLNGADYPRGRLFTLLHEFVHLLLHTEGLCDMVSETRATSPDRALEARCNAVAAAILMPAEAVRKRPQVMARAGRRDAWDYEALAEAAGPFGVSAEAFLRRLVTLGRVDLDHYLGHREGFQRRYEEDEGRKPSNGGNWYHTTARDLGKSFVRQVASAHDRHVIDSYTAARYLGVKVGQIPRLARSARVGEVTDQ
nr:ImmA/IrrE family metallo-endopeptidase [Quadrisphaera setariae]